MKHFFSLFLCFALCMTTLAHAGTDPVATIYDVKTSIETSNEQLFNASVDMESLVGQCVDIFMQDATKEGQTTLPSAVAMLFATAAHSDIAKQTLRDMLMSEVSAFVRTGVASGAYAGTRKENLTPSWDSVLAPLFANASMGRKEILNVGRAIPESGAVYVTFSLKDHANGNTYPVEAWLREQQPGQWRVIGLRNVRTLVRLLRAESTQ